MSQGPLLQKSKQFAVRIIRFYNFLQKEKNEYVSLEKFRKLLMEKDLLVPN